MTLRDLIELAEDLDDDLPVMLFGYSTHGAYIVPDVEAGFSTYVDGAGREQKIFIIMPLDGPGTTMQ